MTGTRKKLRVADLADEATRRADRHVNAYDATMAGLFDRAALTCCWWETNLGT
jgi:hypothetical protein